MSSSRVKSWNVWKIQRKPMEGKCLAKMLFHAGPHSRQYSRQYKISIYELIKQQKKKKRNVVKRFGEQLRLTEGSHIRRMWCAPAGVRGWWDHQCQLRQLPAEPTCAAMAAALYRYCTLKAVDSEFSICTAPTFPVPFHLHPQGDLSYHPLSKPRNALFIQAHLMPLST